MTMLFKYIGLGCLLLPVLFILNNCNQLQLTNTDFVNQETVPPNILFIIADDLGVDETLGYSQGLIKPNMPHLQKLISEGLSFDNVWAYPVYSPTRSSILTGEYSFRTGVTDATDNSELQSSEMILQNFISNNSSTEYKTAVFGKWHVSKNNENAPSELGIIGYKGILSGTADDYNQWNFSENGSSSIYSGYITTKITNIAIDWISDQGVKPWFTWVAYTTPHTLFHIPPMGTHSQGSLSAEQSSIDADSMPYFLAMVENLDYEIGRLLENMSESVRKNTIIIFLGDNGAHRNIIQAPYQQHQEKGSLFQGEIHVPLIISGKGVSRKNQRDDSLISSVDIFATIEELTGVSLPHYNDSYSFQSLLNTAGPFARSINFSQITHSDTNKSGEAIRNKKYKLIKLKSGTVHFFNLESDPFESTNLLSGTLSEEQEATYNFLNQQLSDLLFGKGNEDITGVVLTNKSSSCMDYVSNFYSQVKDVNRIKNFTGFFNIFEKDSKCVFTSNSIPNHDFKDGGNFANVTQEVVDIFEVVQSPVFSSTPVALSLTYDNAIMLNGVKLDMLAVACYGVGAGPLGQEKIGCGDVGTPWRYDPMSLLNNFGTDSHNAHTQPDGAYHYHGSPKVLFVEGVESPVIGFVADGFPIFDPYINDNRTVRAVISSYTLKPGARVNQAGEGAFSTGNYDETFRDDYTYTGQGDLDECNGMVIM